jgi:SHS2 domain-containing protein
MSETSSFEIVEGPTSDLSFEARGPTVEAVFSAAARAFLAITVESIESVDRRLKLSMDLEEPDIELLLLRFLNELIYLRDAQELLLFPTHIEIIQDHWMKLHADFVGESIDRQRHNLESDVKAATAQGLRVAKIEDGWMASVTLDV